MLRAIRLTLEGLGVVTIVAGALAVTAFFYLSDLLQYEDSAQKADYIFPLAGSIERLEKAAELYNNGFAPKLLLTGDIGQLAVQRVGIVPSDGSILGYQLAVLTASQIPFENVLSIGEQVASTGQEAEKLRDFIDGRPAKVIVVVSPYEATRAKIIFQLVVPNARLLIVSTEEHRLPSDWWRDKKSSLIAVAEVSKIVFFLAGGIFRNEQINSSLVAQSSTSERAMPRGGRVN